MASITERLKAALVRFERVGLSNLDKAVWPHVEPRFVALSNLIAGISASVSLSQAAIELAQGAYFYSMSDLIGGLLMLSTVGMNALGAFRVSRVFLLLVLNLDVYYFNIISQFSMGLELLFLMFLLFPFFMFSTREIGSLIITSLVPFGLFCMSRFYPDPLFVPATYIEAAPSWYGIAVPIVAFGATFLVIFRFLRVNEEMQLRVLHHAKFASLGEFAAGISHEINNPLNAVALNTQLLRREVAKHPELPPSFESKLSTIERSTLRASEIIRGLKLFSREADSDPPVHVDLLACIRETLSLCEQRFAAANVRLNVQMQDAPRVMGNPTQISQVLVNLLNNAYDAVQPLEERVVSLDVRQVDANVEIRVSDNGTGIPQKIRDKVMEPFFTTKPVGQGTGLGLSISKGIIEAHRGELFIDEQAAQTTLVIRIPSAPPEGVTSHAS